MRPLTLGRLLTQCAILSAVLFVVVVIALKLGAVPVSLYGLGHDLLRVLFRQSSQLSSEYQLIIFDIRLPRILLGIFVGASLSVAGASFQALLRNPLADPYVLGVSSGAAVGAIIALIIEPHLALAPAVAALLTPIGAFLGAALTITAVYFLGLREGQIDSGTLLLAGIISASFLQAIIMFFMSTLTGGNYRGIAFWMMGELQTQPPHVVSLILRFGFFLAAGTIYTTASDLNSAPWRRKRSDAPRRGRASRSLGRLHCGVLVNGAGRFRQRRNRLRRLARAPRHASPLRLRSSHSVANGRVWRRHRCSPRRHSRAHHRFSGGASRRCHDCHRRRAAFSLFNAQETSLSSYARSSASRSSGDTGDFNSDIRLSVEQVSYAYSANPTQAPLFTLEATSFQARPGEIVAIVGPNACGKSTLLKLIAGALEPLSGRVLLNGFVTHTLPHRTRGQRIAMVQQESPLLFPSRAWEFVLQGRHPYGRMLRFETEEDILIARNALAQVGAEHLSDRLMDQISGGEKQRVILARALAQQPLLLLLDEPTLHLDIGAQVDLLETLRRLASADRYTVVVVTHELNLAGQYADQVALFQKGKCLRVGPPATVFQRELLEQVFQTPLTVELGSSGRPRVNMPPAK